MKHMRSYSQRNIKVSRQTRILTDYSGLKFLVKKIPYKMLKPLLLEIKIKGKNREIGLPWSALRARHSVRNFPRCGDETT